ncbi:uncharacterized protein LOC141666321 [Apium graveolens]|uniref:uncharacterized protein LOC141666321 n=1 Tax=Apium graveolens TaxID=4045 RepID=UPI003D78BFB9
MKVFMQVQGVWDAVETNVVKKLLRAVPSKYLQIASIIEQFGDMESMSVEEVLGRLKAHEERLRGQNESTGGQLLLMQEEWSKQAGKWSSDKGRSGPNNRGKGRNHLKNNSSVKSRHNQAEDGSGSNNTGRDRSKIKCYNCQVFGHYASECRKPRREREWGTLLLNEEGVIPRLGNESIGGVESNVWYLDNGAKECAWLWHTRLGHVNFQALSLMSESEMVIGLPKIPKPKSICGGFLMSKQAHKSFPPKSNFVAKECLELIHGDICGPITPITTGGNRYFLLLVDDYSRVIWVYLLKSKDEALEAFQKFKVLVENGRDQKIKV